MKSMKLYTAIIGLSVLGACTKVLDKNDLSKMTPEFVFSDSTLVQLNMDNIYDNNLPTWGGQNTSSSLSGLQPALTDEGSGTNVLLQGTYSYGTGDYGDFGTSLNTNNSQPSNNWGKIRQLNTFIENMSASPLPEYTKKKFIAQAKFFRAFRYWDLVRIYGGVPLVLTPLDGVGQAARDAALLPRNSTSECIAQMVTDLNYAIANLPGKPVYWGQITSGAAAAMKGRVLLLWASPQFNPNDLTERWQAAYDANVQAKAILDANGYKLHASYKSLWFSEGSLASNPEAVMITGYNTSTGDQTKKNNSYDNATRPKYLGTVGGSNQPTWELVTSYPMKDGKMPGDATGKYTYTDQQFYANRDPRFDATIAYNGCTWPINGNTAYKLWTYYETSTVSTESTASGTGFYCRKAISEGTFTNGDPQYCGTDWIEIRYAEVLLNLAESAAGISKLGTTDESYTALIALRARAGIEAGTGSLYGLASGQTRAQMFKTILNERKVELAFEGKRFWDLMRWKLYETELNGNYRNKIRIQLKTGTGIPTATEFKTTTNVKFRDVTSIDTAYIKYFTVTVQNVKNVRNSTTALDGTAIAWKSAYYFLPLPMVSVANNPNLLQNNTWGGSFDPLK